MKTTPPKFETDKTLQPGYIYMIQQESKRKIVTVESLPTMHLIGKWKVNQQWIRECQK